jgi:hypothetical protein
MAREVKNWAQIAEKCPFCAKGAPRAEGFSPRNVKRHVQGTQARSHQRSSKTGGILMSATEAAVRVVRTGNAGRAIGCAGLSAGVLDITAAFLTWAPKGVTPARILQGIASGLLGAKSFQGGWETAVLGLALHFLIAYSAATVFYAASRCIAFLTERAILAGALYGVAVYVVMYWLVKPLSLVKARPFSWTDTSVAIATHIICVGLPIALAVRRYSR